MPDYHDPGRRKVADDDYDIATLFETVRRCNIDMLREANNIRQLNASIYTWRNERAEALTTTACASMMRTSMHEQRR